MSSRAFKEGAVGLLLLTGLGLLAGSVVWVRGLNLRGDSYQASVELPNALGLNMGSPVQYRGVKVGQVTEVTPSTNGVMVSFMIRPADLLIPRNSIIETSQSGFVGQVTLSISPGPDTQTISDSASLTPFEGACDPTVIVCDGDRLKGAAGSNFDELIRATTRIATLLGDGELLENTNLTLQNLTRATVSFRELSRNANTTLASLNRLSNNAGTTLKSLNDLSQDARREINGLGEISSSINQAALSVTDSATQFNRVGDRFIQTADGIDVASSNVSALIQDNRSELISTLQNLNLASEDLKGVIRDVSPLIGKVNESQIIENLDQLTANGVEASESLKALTSAGNNPQILFELSETLGAARTTFQNTQKITTDLEELTGNAEFRDNLIKLINGLSQLVSSTQELERQYNVIQPAAVRTAARLTPPE